MLNARLRSLLRGVVEEITNGSRWCVAGAIETVVSKRPICNATPFQVGLEVFLLPWPDPHCFCEQRGVADDSVLDGFDLLSRSRPESFNPDDVKFRHVRLFRLQRYWNIPNRTKDMYGWVFSSSLKLSWLRCRLSHTKGLYLVRG